MRRGRGFRVQALRADAWRMVEAQHKVSTMPLVGNNLADQKILEEILEASKPVVPSQARGMHWLLFTPFRYRPPPPGSRFRAPDDTGVFYGAFERRTACAEAGYWRWRFIMDSAGLSGLDAHPMSLFMATVKTRSAVDLREPPLSRRRRTWTDPDDYRGTQAFARTAREEGVEAIVYESVRDPQHGGAVAVLSPTVLAGPDGTPENWFLTITREKVIWQRELGENFEFRFAKPA